MGKRQPTFTTIPPVPMDGMTPGQFQILNSLKDNVEMLTGGRGDVARALTAGQVTVQPVSGRSAVSLTAEGRGAMISNVTVPTLQDYTLLMNDLQLVMNDVAALRETLNALINQLRS